MVIRAMILFCLISPSTSTSEYARSEVLLRQKAHFGLLGDPLLVLDNTLRGVEQPLSYFPRTVMII